jgi:hypothetical protein
VYATYVDGSSDQHDNGRAGRPTREPLASVGRPPMPVIILALVFFFTPVGVSYADTVFSNNPKNEVINVDFTCDTLINPSCRNEQPYVSLVPIGQQALSYDRIQVKLSGVSVTPRIAIYRYQSNDDVYSCSDSSCIDDDTLIQGENNSWTDQGDGIYQMIFTTPVNSTVAGEYIRMILDPNTPYQNFGYYQGQNGQIRNGLNQLEDSFGGPSILLCDGVCNDFPTPFGGTFDIAQSNGTYETRFIDTTITGQKVGSVNDVTFDTQYFTDPDDWSDAFDRPDIIFYYLYDNDNFTSSKQDLILPLPSIPATSTSQLTFNEIPNGDYFVDLSFHNFNTASIVVPRSNMTYSFTVNNGNITNPTLISLSDGTTPLEQFSGTNIPSLSDCGFTNLSACLVAPLYYLFVPSSDSITNTFDGILNSDNPLVANATQAFNQVTSADEYNPNATLEYRLQIAQAGIDVEMFSVNTMTQLMGDSKPIFRAIMTWVLWMGLIGMIIRSIWSRFNPFVEQQQADPPQSSIVYQNSHMR